MIDLSNITLVIYDDFRDDPTESNIRYIILKKVLEYYKDVINFYDILQFLLNSLKRHVRYARVAVC